MLPCIYSGMYVYFALFKKKKKNLDDVNLLNKRSEFISKCRHINKRLLNRVKDDSYD